MTTQQDVIRMLIDTTNNLKGVLDKKGQDYSGKEDTFKNFKISSDILNIKTEKVIISRMLDKISRVSNLVDKSNQVKEESIIDTLDDLVGYTILLKTFILKEKRNNHTKSDHTKSDYKNDPYYEEYIPDIS